MYQSHIINKDPKKLKVITHSLLLKSMEPHRKRMHDLIENSAKKKDEKSKWDLTPPKRPSKKAIEMAQSNRSLEDQYDLYDR